MIDNSICKTIRFSEDDVPELPEIDDREIKIKQMEKQREAERTLQWLQNNAGFVPFGMEW